MGKSSKRRRKKPAKGLKAGNFSQTLPTLLQQGISHHQSGRLQEAEKIYRNILEADPCHADANHLLGVVAYQTGDLESAERLILTALGTDPGQAIFHLNLGNVLQDRGRPEEAIASYQNALAVNPDFPEAHNNMGNALKAAERPQRAITCFRNAIALRPDYAEAHNNLGNTLKDIEDHENAISHIRRAIALSPAYAEAHFNLARALTGIGCFEQAIDSCRQAITLKPGFIDAYINLGVILHKNGNMDDCLATSRQAVSMAPDNPATHAGLANVLRDTAKHAEAISSYRRVIELKPDDQEAWENLQQTTKALLYSQPGGAAAERPSPPAAGLHGKLLEYYLNSFRPHEADAGFDAALAALPGPAAGDSRRLFKQTVALLHFGRSGTGLMHSLIDAHPQISTLPGIYLSGYFNAGVWEQLNAGGRGELPQRFADTFAVLFDANSPKPVPGTQKEGIANAGVKEGMTNTGDDGDRALGVDRDIFCAEARRLMDTFDAVDAGLFLQIVHAAFEHALGRPAGKQTVFYHIHNPNVFAKLNFLRHTPRARLMMMIREPVQSCESWMRMAFEKNEYDSMCFRIITMLYDIDQVAFRKYESVGVRLEDLKSRPQATIGALCGWLGVEETPGLYEMTAQGEKWWGDPSSPDYDPTRAMPAFDDDFPKRRRGGILGQRDRLLLETLFYPFSVRFGYRRPDPDGLKRDLKEARTMLVDPLDFERTLIDRTGVDERRFRSRNNYLLLRAAITDRLDMLDQLGDYPHMLTPLAIDGNGTRP